jgi:hypothetical protein
MIKNLDESYFKDRIGHPFTASWEGKSASLLLKSVERLGPTRKGSAFAAYFEGSGAPTLPQGTYRLRDAGGETIEIFIVPIGRTDGGICYEAVFT